MADNGDGHSNGHAPGAVAPLSDEERERAGLAQSAFEAGSYDKCLEHLSRLHDLRPKDHKVQHNIAVAQYYRSKLTETDDFIKALTSLKTQIDQNVSESESEVDEVERGVLLFNLATVQYQLCHYSEALTILERLFRFAEPLEDSLSRSVCFLLAEIYVRTSEAEKAASMLAYLDKHVGNGSSNGKAEGSEQAVDTDHVYNRLMEKEQQRLHQLKVRLYLLRRSMKACKREVKNVMSGTQGSSAVAIFLKSNFEYVRQNYRKCAKLLTTVPLTDEAVPDSDYLPALFFNNLGCAHSHMHKHHLAALYFHRALQLNSQALSKCIEKRGGPDAAVQHVVHRHYQLLYNCGVELLASSKADAAFECLLHAVQFFHMNPLLWLRLAEACIAKHHQLQSTSRPLTHIQGHVGSGSHHKLLLVASQPQSVSPSQEAAVPTPSLDFANICLHNTILLLQGLEKKRDNGSTLARPVKVASNSNQDAELAENNGEHSQNGWQSHRIDIQAVKNSTLLCNAYVNLCLGDPVMALKWGRQLLAQPNLPGAHKCLGCLYTGEALLELGQVDEAIRQLSPDSVTDMNITYPPPVAGTDKPTGRPDGVEGDSWEFGTPRTVPAGRATLLLNLSAAFCLNSDTEKARKCLHQACNLLQHRELPSTAIQLAVFLELQAGNTMMALQILKKHHIPVRSSDKGGKRSRKT